MKSCGIGLHQDVLWTRTSIPPLPGEGRHLPLLCPRFALRTRGNQARIQAKCPTCEEASLSLTFLPRGRVGSGEQARERGGWDGGTVEQLPLTKSGLFHTLGIKGKQVAKSRGLQKPLASHWRANSVCASHQNNQEVGLC